MAEPHIVTTLRTKRDELDRLISSYEGALAAARRDFVNVNSTLELFEKGGSSAVYSSHLSIVRMFKRGELFALCKTALAGASGDKKTAAATAAPSAAAKSKKGAKDERTGGAAGVLGRLISYVRDLDISISPDSIGSD